MYQESVGGLNNTNDHCKSFINIVVSVRAICRLKLQAYFDSIFYIFSNWCALALYDPANGHYYMHFCICLSLSAPHNSVAAFFLSMGKQHGVRSREVSVLWVADRSSDNMSVGPQYPRSLLPSAAGRGLSARPLPHGSITFPFPSTLHYQWSTAASLCLCYMVDFMFSFLYKKSRLYWRRKVWIAWQRAGKMCLLPVLRTPADSRVY